LDRFLISEKADDPMEPAKKLISVVTPCYNEVDNVHDCYEAVREIFEVELCAYDYEHIFCDNASVDGTVEVLKEIAAQDKRVKIIVNARNFGPFRSTFNGLLHTKGDAVLVQLAADLQDPPELISNFVRKWEQGYQVVYGVRKTREESVVMVMARKIYYRVINRFADAFIPPDAGEFQLIDRVVVETLRKFDDYYPYIRGMIAECGFKSIGIEYTWQARKKGFSKNKLYHLIDQGLNGITSSINIPLRLCMFLGFVLSALSLLYAFIQLAINLWFYRQLAPPGIATLIVGVFFFNGIQLFFIGVLGEYINAIHSQVRRKFFIVEREKINF
jgi:glycosyltransferase involved in cell wall biosynthesis